MQADTKTRANSASPRRASSITESHKHDHEGKQLMAFDPRFDDSNQQCCDRVSIRLGRGLQEAPHKYCTHSRKLSNYIDPEQLS
jgi:hypothetical protein